MKSKQLPKGLLAAGLFLLLLAACTTPVEVVSARPQGEADFSSYQTFNFLDISVKNDSLADVNSQPIQLLKAAIVREMEARNYRLSPDPDLWINIGIMIEQKVQTRETDIRDAPLYIGQRRYSWQSEDRVVRRYEQGTVIIDVVDAARYERIWEGVVTGTLSENPQRLEERINEAMRLLFEEYPSGREP
jgi:hypothetical protein